MPYPPEIDPVNLFITSCFACHNSQVRSNVMWIIVEKIRYDLEFVIAELFTKHLETEGADE